MHEAKTYIASRLVAGTSQLGLLNFEIHSRHAIDRHLWNGFLTFESSTLQRALQVQPAGGKRSRG